MAPITPVTTTTAGTTAPTPGRASVRRITGLKPTGHLHLGNLVGAIRPTVAGQYRTETIVFLADLHALTVTHQPAQIRTLTLEQATVLLAAGLDPDRALLYVQSQVPQHTELHYLLECATGYGEAQRMIQFREKSARHRQVRLSLLSYPVLMAADILLHDVHEVPVGDDQSQHLELTRTVANRFNARYGDTFTVPRAVHPTVSSRVMDLADPTAKMGKTSSSEAGTILLLDPPEVIRRKVLRAVTDPDRTVGYDPQRRPGVANLLEILAACLGGSPTDLAADYGSYAQLKKAVAEAVESMLRPIRLRYTELSRDPGYVRRVLADGADRARDNAADTVHRAKRALGLLSH
ncbi:tryptophan--tRNA ligase [Plantactinospora endophytica]|uniref:Tryptophan--tRNA ligase n=1 Tax=Plantactinospora endophytica TaxID=673535 RepID=A0ABQ4EDJ8_9ACTN|nr:tryptophan--tRNA ligase [Plantactinospora endophytica]GIG92803.1 tryptophan--tRNA ligase 1 [Plantactinospora endophytica]